MENRNLKYCPRCNDVFERKTHSIKQCQCTHIELSKEERVYIADKYSECLCLNCLREVKGSIATVSVNRRLGNRPVKDVHIIKALLIKRSWS